MKKIFSGIGDYIMNTDKLLWIFSISATVYGALLLWSVERAGGSYVKTQLLASIIGYTVAVIISMIDYEYIARYWWILAILSMLLFASVFLFGMTVTGTDDTAWIRLPGGLTFQPSELVKVFFIVTFAKHLDYLKKTERLMTFGAVVTLLGHALVPIAIIHVQGDDGSALIFFFIALIMMFTAGVQARYFIILLCGVAVGVPVLWNVIMNDEHRNRIMALMDLDGNALTDYGYQQYQSKVSIASGGATGYGLGEGYRTGLGYVPEHENDFIFSVAGEDLGFLGCLLVLLILFTIIVLIFRNAVKSRDELGAYICYGVLAMLASQTLINIGMVIGLLPVIGITLPFFSQGGTSAMCICFSIGLVQSVRMHNKNVDSVKVSYTRNERIKI
ncbi:MAG: FtsW/RodA/SpoVE family cell cycle protein [Clostridia bacterium]|nr:FtsW/RodA/SpoVE family cell cycle protein [Clostridia bacterium]